MTVPDMNVASQRTDRNGFTRYIWARWKAAT